MIKEITANTTFPVRHPVLRAGKSIETCYFDGDEFENTKHFGYYDDEKLIGVISVFKKSNALFLSKNQFQIRGMAVLEAYQKKGFGHKLMQRCEEYVLENAGSLIWFNARLNAISFYENLGYKKTGNSFEIENIGTHYLMNKSFID